MQNYQKSSAVIITGLVLIALITTAVPVSRGASPVSHLMTSRTVRVGAATARRASQIVIPVEMDAFGDECALSFSLNFDPAVLGSPTAVAGPGAPAGSAVTMNINQVDQGKLGILIDSVNTFSPSPPARVFLLITFAVSPHAPLGTSSVSFSDSPAPLSTANNNADYLDTLYNGGVVDILPGFYGDVASRPGGDGQLLSSDAIIERQFVVGLATPDAGEFFRADTAPRDTHGDGVLTAGDTIQVRRYVAGLDPVDQVSAALEVLRTLFDQSNTADERVSSALMNRSISLSQVQKSTAGKIVLNIDLNQAGDESAAGFTLEFDAAKLRDPVVALASSRTAVLTTNVSKADDGQLAVLVDSDRGLGAGRILRITFDIAPGAEPGPTWVNFTDSIAPRSVADDRGTLVETRFDDAVVIIPGHKIRY